MVRICGEGQFYDQRTAVLQLANGNAACLEVRRSAVGATDLKPWLHV
jgi:hypothetical protein